MYGVTPMKSGTRLYLMQHFIQLIYDILKTSPGNLGAKFFLTNGFIGFTHFMVHVYALSPLVQVSRTHVGMLYDSSDRPR